MTRRGFLRRALASAAFVAGAQFATLVPRRRLSEDCGPTGWSAFIDGHMIREQYRLRNKMILNEGKLMGIYQDVLKGGPHVPWAFKSVSVHAT